MTVLDNVLKNHLSYSNCKKQITDFILTFLKDAAQFFLLGEVQRKVFTLVHASISIMQTVGFDSKSSGFPDNGQNVEFSI